MNKCGICMKKLICLDQTGLKSGKAAEKTAAFLFQKNQKPPPWKSEGLSVSAVK